jgi:hypothetical protein
MVSLHFSRDPLIEDDYPLREASTPCYSFRDHPVAEDIA